ncbi:MAG: hypothetical protein ACPL7D_11470 [Candidatus Sumerlaeaceae bacterium]
MTSGIVFVPSLVFLMFVLAGVYSLAQEPFAHRRHLARQWLRRSIKLASVLAGIMILAFFFSRV